MGPLTRPAALSLTWVNDLRPDRDSNAGPTAKEVVLRPVADCRFPGQLRVGLCLASGQCLWFLPSSGTRRARVRSSSPLPAQPLDEYIDAAGRAVQLSGRRLGV